MNQDDHDVIPIKYTIRLCYDHAVLPLGKDNLIYFLIKDQINDSNSP